MSKIIISLILLTGFFSTHGQTITGQVFIQQTVMGVQKGYGFRYHIKDKFGIGALFQSNGKLSIEDENGNYPFYGIETIVPIVRCSTLKVSLAPKAGFVNQNFFVLIPEVETEIRVSKMISAGIITGIRARKSSSGIKLIVHL